MCCDAAVLNYVSVTVLPECARSITLPHYVKENNKCLLDVSITHLQRSLWF